MQQGWLRCAQAQFAHRLTNAHPMELPQSLAPDFRCLLALPILLGDHTQVIAGAYGRIVERTARMNALFRFIRDNSIRLRHYGFAKIGFAIRTLTE